MGVAARCSFVPFSYGGWQLFLGKYLLKDPCVDSFHEVFCDGGVVGHSCFAGQDSELSHVVIHRIFPWFNCRNFALASPSESEASKALFRLTVNCFRLPKSLIGEFMISRTKASFQARAVPSVMYDNIKMIFFSSVS